MKARIMAFIFFIIFFLLVDIYLFQAILAVSRDWSPVTRNALRYGYWIPTMLSIVAVLWWVFGNPYEVGPNTRSFILTALFATYVSKVFGILVLFVDDIQRGIKWVANFFYSGSKDPLPGKSIPRSEFLTKAALVASTIPFGAMAYGIISGAHDYRVRRVTVKLPNLPKSFDGLRIGQISDIHSGSFFNKTAVKGGVEMMLKEKPDVIFFTGDLVNNESTEVKDYIDIFGKLKAPLGVFSVTGNHDYGDYHHWDSLEAKKKNFQGLIEAHRLLNYDLLMNEHRFLEQGGDKIAIIGNENWGAGRFSKYGRLDLAHRGTDEAAVKLLLSHDPSHWDAEVRPKYKDIDIAFAGHTHGFQFGVEIGKIKWSPSQYVYKQWAGLYQEGSQYIYVNRGFGYLGYPGRIGMPPELTIVELKRA
jgi:predicted MPP superfamily phosphohydrolase